MKLTKTLIAAAVAAGLAAPAWAAVSADEARQLGTKLTPVGAEKAGNKEGTIPPYEGGLTTFPAGFKKGDSKRPDPFASDKPRLVITAKNMEEHADKLTEGTKALLKKYPTFRLDVYPTRRPVVLPKQVLDNTLKNAVAAKTNNDGLGLENVLPGIPFPIPKSGNEAMWNHLLRYQGVALHAKYDSWNVDSAGVPTLATTGEANYEWPIYSPKNIGSPIKGTDAYWRVKLHYHAPARRAGEALMAVDSVDPLQQPRRAWQYLPGQRRVRAAPDIAYDTPNPGTAGASTYDDANIFNGAMDRYDFKLVGKKEMIVPYSAYRMIYHPEVSEITKPNHVNPDLSRWELHRVWVVEATLKPGKRHIYSKRVIYLDEDSWTGMATDKYDARGNLYRSAFTNSAFSYDAMALSSDGMTFYDFVSGLYNVTGLFGRYFGNKYVDLMPATEWAPEALAGSGVR